MSGKIYTMKEMKTIVEYIAERKLYGEVKGRKMWMDFANSSLTNRSWQSLKETFLKRILPDIHNPYYGLSREQIFSFRQGYDVQERNQNKLEIEAVGENSNSNGENKKNIEKHIVSSADNGEEQGEPIISAQITTKSRSSRETPEPQNCYKTADDILKDLESPTVNIEKEGKSSNVEKVLPVIEKIINDFANNTEDIHKKDNEATVVELKEKPHDIESVEKSCDDKTNANTNNDIKSLETVAMAKDKILGADEVEATAQSNIDIFENEKESINNSTTDACVEKPPQENKSGNDTKKDAEKQDEDEAKISSANEVVNRKDVSDDILEPTTLHDKNNDATSDSKKIDPEAKQSLTNDTQNITNTNSDSILPNNQEELQGNKLQLNDTLQLSDNETEKDKGNIEPKRKRGSSMDTVVIDKKYRKFSEPSTSKQNGSLYKEPNKSDDDLTDPEVFAVDDSSDVEAGLTTPVDDTNTNYKSGNVARNNPCLKNISLFAEQFNKKKYTESTYNDDKKMKKSSDPKPSGSKKTKTSSSKETGDIVVLKSHSDSDSNEEPQEKKRRISDRPPRAQRDKAFANVFGVAHGGAPSKSKRKSGNNNGGHRQTNTKVNADNASCPDQKRYVECNDSESESGGWTTETEQGNFVLPPRGRRNKHAKKYMKPKSTRILSLEEEGGLFIMYGKRIYPIVKDGRIVKNYVIYESNSDSGFDQESYWKVKYAELKKKYEEHKKWKEESERVQEQRHSSVAREPSSPILQSNIRKPPQTPQKQDIQTPSTSKSNPVPDNVDSIPSRPVENTSNSKITIKYIVNNAEVQLEGHWPQICPIFDKVVNILPSKPEPPAIEPKVNPAANEPTVKPVSEPTVKPVSEPNVTPVEETEQTKVIVVSGVSTPVEAQEDAAARVEKLENEIFKEIAEKDQEEEAKMEIDEKPEEKVEQNINVSTRKRGRKAKLSLARQDKSPRTQRRISEKEPTPLSNVESHKSGSVKDYSIEDLPADSSKNVIARRTRQSMRAGLEADKVEEPKQIDESPKENYTKNKTGKGDSKAKNMLPPTTAKSTKSSSQTPSNSRVPKPRRYK